MINDNHIDKLDIKLWFNVIIIAILMRAIRSTQSGYANPFFIAILYQQYFLLKYWICLEFSLPSRLFLELVSS